MHRDAMTPKAKSLWSMIKANHAPSSCCAITLALLFSSCGSGTFFYPTPSVTFVGTDTLVVEKILGFIGDSSIAIQRNTSTEDWYESEEDYFVKDRTNANEVRLYNYVSNTHSAAIRIPDYVDMHIFGSKVYFENDESYFLLDFQSKKYRQLSPNPFAGIATVSGDGNIVYTCQLHSISLINTGKSRKIDSIQSDLRSCYDFELVSNGELLIMYTRNGTNLQYSKIQTDAVVSPLIDTDDIFTASVFVQNIGNIPYTLSGDSLSVPQFIDPSERLEKAFIKMMNVGPLYSLTINHDLNKYIKENVAYDFETGAEIYSAKYRRVRNW